MPEISIQDLELFNELVTHLITLRYSKIRYSKI